MPLKNKPLSRDDGIEFSFDHPLQPKPAELISCHQVHGTELMWITSQNKSDARHEKKDGLITQENFLIGVQTGDCIPALFYDANTSVVAAVHAGWRGVLSGILPNAVELFAKANIRPQDVRVILGPSIQSCCFEVSNDLPKKFEESWGKLWKNAEKPWTNQRHPKPESTEIPTHENIWMDLQEIARLQLLSTGVKSVEKSEECTYCNPKGYASHRRNTHHQSKEKLRQWSWIKKTS